MLTIRLSHTRDCRTHVAVVHIRKENKGKKMRFRMSSSVLIEGR
jgi:hypothetical protein